MSINHFSPDLPETHCWAQQQHHHHQNMEPSFKPNTLAAAPTAFWANSQIYQPIEANNPLNSALNFDLNNEDEDETAIIEDGRENNDHIIKQVEEKEIAKEPLFEKPLTPSDVGKLNRLVIPKQHAEKYFPLGGNDSGGEKGLLLSFEDESGKPWRFRYSYWNSSQSYVLTKGWSRFVKEKRLDAGDIVLFERHRLDGDRLFIGWRRRRSSAAAAAQEKEGGGVAQGQPATVGGGWTRVYFPAGHHDYPPPQQQQQHHHHGPALPYQHECVHAGIIFLHTDIFSKLKYYLLFVPFFSAVNYMCKHAFLHHFCATLCFIRLTLMGVRTTFLFFIIFFITLSTNKLG